MIRSQGASHGRPSWDNPDLSFPGRCPGPSVAVPQMSQLAWASLAALIAFCFHAPWGFRRAQRRGLAGLVSRDGARLRLRRSAWCKVLAQLHLPRTPPPPHVMPHCAVLGRTRPRGTLWRHETAGHPSCPAAFNEVMGWGPGDPLLIGWGLLQLAQEWSRG